MFAARSGPAGEEEDAPALVSRRRLQLFLWYELPRKWLIEREEHVSVADALGSFFDELGRSVARLAPQPQPDLRSDAELKALIRAMPDGTLAVGSVVEETDEVVFTVTAPRAAVKALVKPGDRLRIARDGSVEIVPTGIPGLFDQLQRNVEDLKRRFFGP